MVSAPPRSPIPRIADLPLVVETQRLVLRPLELGDADALFEFASDPEVSKMMAWDPHEDRGVTVAFLERMIAAREAGTSVGWAILVDGKPAGVISLDGITWQFRAWRVDQDVERRHRELLVHGDDERRPQGDGGRQGSREPHQVPR